MSLRVLLDTNVRISSLITPEGACARLIAGLQHTGDMQIISAFLLKELEGTLAAKFRWPAAHIALALRATSAITEHVSQTSLWRRVVIPMTTTYVSVLFRGAANVIVTGDDDLLTLHPWHGIQIVTVRRFPELYPNIRTDPVP